MYNKINIINWKLSLKFHKKIQGLVHWAVEYTDCISVECVPVDFNQQNPVDGTLFGRPWCQQHGFGRVCVGAGHTSSLRRPSSLALTSLRGARFIAWRQRRPFLGQCRWDPRHFWECQARLGYGPALGSTLKKPCATLLQWDGRQIPETAEYTDCISVDG